MRLYWLTIRYQLTPALNSQIGAVWGTNRINLAQPFDYKANVFLGAAILPVRMA